MSPIWFQILLSLADADRHGLSVMQDVLERTGGTMRLWPAMLYRNLQKLQRDGLIEEVAGPETPMPGSPRFFHITAAGKRACTAEARRLAAFVEVAREKRLLRKPR